MNRLARDYRWLTRDRYGRRALALVRLGAAIATSGLTWLPYPTRARLDALYAAARRAGAT